MVEKPPWRLRQKQLRLNFWPKSRAQKTNGRLSRETKTMVNHGKPAMF
jgi:hypothetical protein